MFSKNIDYDRCTACMDCLKICTNSRVIVQNDQGLPEFKYDYKCIYCGHCLAICPEMAIKFEPVFQADPAKNEYIAPSMPLNHHKVMLNGNNFREFLASTRTNRLFLDRPVARETMDIILDAMIRSPSAGNEQNRNFYILSDRSQIEQLEKRLTDYYQKTLQIYKNPVLLRLLALIGARKAIRENRSRRSPEGRPNPGPAFRDLYRFFKTMFQGELLQDNAGLSYLRDSPVVIIITSNKKASMLHQSFYKGDVTIAATYGTLMAQALGLASCWLGLLEIAGNKDRKIKESLNIAADERIDSALALGYSDLAWKQIPPRGPVKVVWS
jgi:nitroreductase/NAD-dependent dihydropyrimidine dehydrogenase PreA subunit